ncbi:hypothetical protein OP10G_1348 [Fimbriimonas ginsengisoli Gsoil 348]|uniref:Uncharacterized protein n=1 Tax=Fimbriimonas ginsengisoli Gsoil 348 TaxID=661478 RepID=A0A068NMN0_FIMGI|nr:hypothetical protein OP10G_1348 [Fimbriimonas ginsengisoli Gsoil 348]
MYIDLVKNVTISVPDDLWRGLNDEAAEKRLSLNAYVRELLEREIGRKDTMGGRLVSFAREHGPAPQSWNWNRAEIYEGSL